MFQHGRMFANLVHPVRVELQMQATAAADMPAVGVNLTGWVKRQVQR